MPGHWKRSLAAAIVVLILLGAAPGAGSEAADDFSIRLDQLSEAFGPGSNGPSCSPSTRRAGSGQRAAARRTAPDRGGYRGRGGGRAAPAVGGRRDGDDLRGADHGASEERTSDLLERLRDDVILRGVEGTPLKGHVGGDTAGFEDFSDKVASRLPLFIRGRDRVVRAAPDRVPLALDPARLVPPT